MPRVNVKCPICGKSVDARGLKAHQSTHQGKVAVKKLVSAPPKTKSYPLSPITGSGSIAQCPHCSGLILLMGNAIRHVTAIADIAEILMAKPKAEEVSGNGQAESAPVDTGEVQPTV
jgi:hypothetical protein